QGYLSVPPPPRQSKKFATLTGTRRRNVVRYAAKMCPRRNLAADATLPDLSKQGGPDHDQPSPFSHCSFGANPAPRAAPCAKPGAYPPADRDDRPAQRSRRGG